MKDLEKKISEVLNEDDRSSSMDMENAEDALARIWAREAVALADGDAEDHEVDGLVSSLISKSMASLSQKFADLVDVEIEDAVDRFEVKL